MGFEPKIVAFCCNWCAYAAADLAGTARMKYPHNVRVIRVMCSGMVHPELVLEALTQGIDGVMLLGCQQGECHYIDGNEKAFARSEMVWELFEDFGHDSERYQIRWMSSSEPELFVQSIAEMTELLKKLGPVNE